MHHGAGTIGATPRKDWAAPSRCGGWGVPPPPWATAAAARHRAACRLDSSSSALVQASLPKNNGARELVDPYVQVDLHAVRLGANNIEEHVKVPFKTPRVNDNGFNPVWKKGATKEFKVHSRDIAMIHFRIVDDDLGKDDKIASSSIPISCLRKGYRSIQLYDLNNTRTGPFNSSILFVKIE